MVPIMLTWFLALALFAVWGFAVAWPTDDERPGTSDSAWSDD